MPRKERTGARTAACLLLLLSSCNSVYKESNKVALAETSSNFNGIHRKSAAVYSGTMEFGANATVRVKFSSGTARFGGRTLRSGCHIIRVRKGGTLDLNTRNLEITLPASSCPDSR
ncbi:hypothetical protein HNR42_001333 [Deinobacterium chartae]|uniref:Uncharacterized protein n=1 Tax=Deinobacterium chartae TaxID=521158 RepID=A0A841I0D8_9DEIO|nr:hypothetical protein [Deinobacterium chartae]